MEIVSINKSIRLSQHFTLGEMTRTGTGIPNIPSRVTGGDDQDGHGDPEHSQSCDYREPPQHLRELAGGAEKEV